MLMINLVCFILSYLFSNDVLSVLNFFFSFYLLFLLFLPSSKNIGLAQIALPAAYKYLEVAEGT